MKLFRGSGQDQDDGELVAVAKAVVRTFQCTTGEVPDSGDVELLRSKDILLEAHRQYGGLWTESCLSRG